MRCGGKHPTDGSLPHVILYLVSLKTTACNLLVKFLEKDTEAEPICDIVRDRVANFLSLIVVAIGQVSYA